VCWVSVFWVVDEAANGALVSVHSFGVLFSCLIKLVKSMLGFVVERKGGMKSLGECFEFCDEFGFHLGIFFDFDACFFPVC